MSVKEEYIGPSSDPKRYKLLESLGKGANAEVYSVVDGNGNIFTIKLTHLSRGKNIQLEQKKITQQEVFCLKKIKNFCNGNFSCFVEDFEVQGNNGRYAIVMKYDEDFLSLDQFLKMDFPLTAKEVEKIAHQMEKLVVLLHKNRITHGDLHLSNFIIHPLTLKVKIIDFAKCDDLIEPEDREYDLHSLEYLIQEIKNRK